MKKLIIAFILLIGLVIVFVAFNPAGKAIANAAVLNLAHTEKTAIDTQSYYPKHREALALCKQKGYQTNWCLLADMQRHSGLKRLYLWNFADSSIANSWLISHGCGKLPWGQDFSRKKATFSNTPESHCSSLGKYKIGARGISSWGIKVNYLLHGLDSTNSNALSRAIVFHSWEAVSDQEQFPSGTAEGWGCPAVSNNALRAIDSLIQNSSKSVLLWQF